MGKRLPKHLKGPFVNSFYDARSATIYLKNLDGQYTTTAAYPSFFIRANHAHKFPMDEYGKSILETIKEGDYLRYIYDPQLHYSKRREMVEVCEEEGVPLYEADLHPIVRWFSDTGSSVSQKFKSLYFDIETHPLKIGFDDEAKKQHRIISFAAYDEDGNSWFVAANEDTNEEEVKVIKELLRICKDYDVLLAWNGNNYDFFVLKARCKLHGIRVDWRDWNLLDHMLVVKKALMSISDTRFKRSFRLDAIGENVLGIQKIKLAVPPGEMHTLLGRREAELEEYNRRDVEIMLQIEQRREFLKLHYAICALCRTFPDRSSIYPNALADGILLRHAIQENKHFPTRKGWDDENEKPDFKYEGAYVLDPLVGFHQGIQVPDFASLYPSIIISFNMSKETMLREDRTYPPEVEADHALCTSTKVRFRTDFEGMLPKVVKQLMTKRKEYKVRSDNYDVGSEEWKSMNNLSTAVKVVTNSFYGLLGNEGSRYYEREIARSITLTGQLLIHKMMNYFDDKGYQSIYGDSVTGNRATTVRINGYIHVVTFEELWNTFNTTALPWRKDKEIKYADPNNKLIETVCRNDKGESEWKPINKIIRHKTNKNIYRITTPYGETEVTEDHSIASNGKFITPAELIESNSQFDTIPLPPVEKYKSNDVIDLWEYLREFSYCVHYKSRLIHYRFEKVGNSVVLEGFGTPSGLIPRIITQETIKPFLRLIAAYITEGSSSIRSLTSVRWLFSIAQNEKKWLRQIQDDFYTIFPGFFISDIMHTGGNTHAIRTTSADVCLFFTVLCGYKSEGKRIPPFIYKLGNDLINFFIDCLVSGDGHINPSGTVGYTSKSQLLIAGVSNLLSILSVRHSFKYRPSKDCWTINTITKNRNTWLHKTHVTIRSADNEYVYDLEVEDNHTFTDGIGRVVLHNTDSIFVKCSVDEMRNELEEINQRFIPRLLHEFGCRECAISLDFDKGFKTLLMVTKKRYAGRLALHKGRLAPDDMEPEIKGIEVQRSDQFLYGQRLLKKYIPLLLEPDVDPGHIDQMIRTDGQEFYAKELDKEEIQITKSVQKNPDDYAVKNPQVRVAEQMIEEGAEFFVGMKIPYIVMEHKPNVHAIHADKYDGKCDRDYYWIRAILPPIQRLLDARFQGYAFNNFKSPNQRLLDFYGNTVKRKRRLRMPKQEVKRVRKPVARRVRAPIATITIPSHINVGPIKGISKIIKAHQGNMRVKIIINLEEPQCAVDINPKEAVSMRGLKEIANLFPGVSIVPKPI